VKPVHEGLFGCGDDGVAYLVGGRCASCGRFQFPVATTCPACGAADVESTRLGGRGTLWGWTAVTAAPPGYLGEIPFGFGVVELAEGLRVITRLEEADPAALSFGMPMELTLVQLGPDADGDVVTTYSFAPAAEAAT
jgi:uncharacterized OB-fold protein